MASCEGHVVYISELHTFLHCKIVGAAVRVELISKSDAPKITRHDTFLYTRC